MEYNSTDDFPASQLAQKHNEPLIERVTKPYRIPGLAILENILRAFSPSERALLYGFSMLMGASVFTLVAILNMSFMQAVPSHGGSLTEGIVGTPRFINPLLAASDADRDLAALVYSGLMRATPDNDFIKDLASEMIVSEDGLTYIFTINDDARFHDGTPVTAGDVAFTVAMAQHPDVKSPRRADWEGVVVEEVDEKTVQFILPRPYAAFLENASLGVLPKHLWQNIAITEFPFNTLNTNPVGSGPFRISKIQNNSLGTPERYTLSAFSGFVLEKPLLDTIVFNFFPNEEGLFTSLTNGRIEAVAGVAPDRVDRVFGRKVIRTPLPRIFGLFFNQTKSKPLEDEDVREALSIAIDKQAIIDDNLLGYGIVVDDPALPDAIPQPYEDILPTVDRTAKALAILENAGWKLGEDGIRAKKDTRLALSITTADTPELAGTADSVARAWRDVGADVTVKVFSTSDLTNTVIRPRDYQVLLFGEVVGRSLDLFAFWHSSQRNDPGLNLALYANVSADKLLVDMRKDNNIETRLEKSLEFIKIIKEETPATFLYAPEFIYAVPNGLHGVRIGSLTTPSERFLNVYEWHRETEYVWDIFTSN
jgi:peptide/nickel transport system substrate-binding protein